MIYLESPYLIIEGLTILRDHANTQQFYYFPNAPRLARNPDGSPSFLFLQYREDLSKLPEGAEPGGGFLSFDVDLRVDDATLDSARRRIKRELELEDEPLLAPLDYRRGRTRLVFLDLEDTDIDDGERQGDEEPRFVITADYAASPSLYGDNRATFSVQLSARGATLLEETLDTRTSLIGVVYDLTFLGLRPAYNVNLSIDWDRVYSHVEDNLKIGLIYFQADIAKVVDKLIEERVIQLDVVSFGVGESDADLIARKDEAVARVNEFITEKFFEPSLNPKAAISGRWYSELGAAAKNLVPKFSGYSRRSLERVDSKRLLLNLREQAATERRIMPQGHLQGLLETLRESPRENYIREVDLRDPFFESVGVEVIGASAIDHDGIEAIQVHLEYGDEAVPQPRDVMLQSTEASSRVRWTLDPKEGLAYRYRYRVTFGADAPSGATQRLESPWRVSNATKLMIDPRDLYQVENVKVQAVGLPFDRYAMVEVKLLYKDKKENLELTHTVVLSPTQDNHEWTFRRRPDGPTRFEYRLKFYPSGAEPVETDWRTSLDPAVLVSDLLPNELNVMVAPAGDFERIRRIMVEMIYDNPETKVRQMDLLTFDKDEMKSWRVRLVDPNRREYQYRVIVQYRDGSIKSLPSIVSSDQLIFVGDVFERTAKVKVSPAGQNFKRAGLNKVRVQLSYTGKGNRLSESTDLIFTSLSDSFEWNYRIHDPALQSYDYQITYFQDDGFIRRDPPQQSTHEHLVIPIPSTL